MLSSFFPHGQRFSLCLYPPLPLYISPSLFFLLFMFSSFSLSLSSFSSFIIFLSFLFLSLTFLFLFFLDGKGGIRQSRTKDRIIQSIILFFNLSSHVFCSGGIRGGGGGGAQQARAPSKFLSTMFLNQVLYQNASKWGSGSMREHLTPLGPNSRRLIIFKSTDYLNLLTTISAKLAWSNAYNNWRPIMTARSNMMRLFRAYCSQQI